MNMRRIFILLAVIVATATQGGKAAVPGVQHERTSGHGAIVRHEVSGRDTLRMHTELPTIRTRMLMSPWPVQIQQRGRHLCVESERTQLLPVYTVGGSFYTAIRLQRGTNWLGGLPRGTYIINHRRFTIG